MNKSVGSQQDDMRREFHSQLAQMRGEFQSQLSQARSEFLFNQEQLHREIAQLKRENQDLRDKCDLVNAKVEYVDKTVRDMEFSKYVIRHMQQ